MQQIMKRKTGNTPKQENKLNYTCITLYGLSEQAIISLNSTMMDTWVGVSHEVEALSGSDTKQCGRHDGYISFSLPHRLIHLVCYKFNKTSILKSSRTEVSLALRIKDYHMSLTSRVFTLCQLRWIHKAIAVYSVLEMFLKREETFRRSVSLKIVKSIQVMSTLQRFLSGDDDGRGNEL